MSAAGGRAGVRAWFASAALGLAALAIGALPAGCAVGQERNHGVACARAGAVGSGPECTRDADCGICHDGSDCGSVRRADEIARRGDACRRADAAQCECATVHCCSQRCVLSPYCGGR